MAATTCTSHPDGVFSKTAIRNQNADFGLNDELTNVSLAWLLLQRTNMMGQLVPYFVHDAVQPLTAICNYSSGLLSKNSNCSLGKEELSNVLTEINQGAFRASAIVKRMGRNSNVNLEEVYSINVNDLVHQVLQLVGGFFRAEQVSVKTTFSDSLPLVLTSPDGLEQLVLNLIKNAAETMRMLPSKCRSIEISTQLAFGSIQIAIKDSGPLITDDVWANLGCPFFTTKTASLGLGIWASKTILRQSGGKLHFQRRAPQGLAAIVCLPIQPH